MVEAKVKTIAQALRGPSGRVADAVTNIIHQLSRSVMTDILVTTARTGQPHRGAQHQYSRVETAPGAQLAQQSLDVNLDRGGLQVQRSGDLFIGQRAQDALQNVVLAL